MNNKDCEGVLIAAMSELDGGQSELTEDRLNSHLAQCAECEREIKELRALDTRFATHQRRVHDVDVWSGIKASIRRESEKTVGWYVFASVIGLLVLYKLFEMVPERDFGLAFKFIPLALMIALFWFLKENPFKINPGVNIGESI